MYVFKETGSGKYLTGNGYDKRLTTDLDKAKIFQRPDLVVLRISRYNRAPEDRDRRLNLIPVKIEVREARSFEDEGE